MSIRTLSGLIAAGLLAFSNPAAAADADRSYPVNVAAKLSRGVVNIVGSPLEIAVNAYKQQQIAHDAGASIIAEGAALLSGTFSGIGFTTARILTAAVELISFPIPTPPLMEPVIPRLLVETIGPPGPNGFFRAARRGGEAPRRSRNDWNRSGAGDDDFYADRWECASDTLRSGLFNQCLEARGWAFNRD